MPDPTSSDLTPTCDPASRRRISSGGHRHPLVITQLLTLGAQLHNVSRVWFPGLLWVVWGLGWDWVVTRRARVGLNVFLLPFWHENANTATSHQPAAPCQHWPGATRVEGESGKLKMLHPRSSWDILRALGAAGVCVKPTIGFTVRLQHLIKQTVPSYSAVCTVKITKTMWNANNQLLFLKMP